MKSFIIILLLFPVFLTAQPVYTYWHGYADVTVTATYGNDSIVVAVDEGTFAGGAYQTGNHTLASFPFSSLPGGGLKAWFVCNLFQITRYNPVTQRITLFNLDKPNQLVPSGVFRVFLLEETENTLGDVVGMFPIFADGNGSGAMTGINPFEAACIINHYSLRAAGGSIAKDATLDGLGSVSQPLKIAQQGAAVGEVLTWDGGTWTPSSVGGSGLVDGNFGDLNVIADPLEFTILDDKVDGVKVLDESLTGDDIQDGTINASDIGDGQVRSDEIDTDAVGAAEIAANAVGSSEIAADAVGASEIATDAVGSAEIAANAVGTAEIADGAVTMPKIAQSGATTGQVLEWNGTAWAPATDDTGGGGSPGGSTGQVQYNNAGAFAGEADLFWDATNNRLGIGTSSPIKPLHVIASAEDNGVAIGENDALNLMLLGYDNTNNRGAIQSYNNGSASHLNINPTGGNLGIGINAAPAYKIDQMNGVARFCFSSSGFTPYVNSSASFQRNDTYNYLEVRSTGGRDLLGSGSGVGYLQHEGTSEMQFWNATTIGGTAYKRFAIPNGSGGLLKQFVGGSTAGASSTETRVPGSIFAITADGAVSNTTTETTVLGTAAGTKTLPTNFFSAAGSTCRVTVCGTITNTGTPTLDLKLKYGSTVIASTGATTLVGITGTGNFTATFMVTCRTTGASGTVRASGTLTYFSTGTTPNLVQFADQNTTINTTTSNAIDLTATWSIADASNTVIGTISVVEIIY